MPPSVPTSTEKELGKDDYLQALSPGPQLHSSCPDFASLQCPHVSTKGDRIYHDQMDDQTLRRPDGRPDGSRRPDG